MSVFSENNPVDFEQPTAVPKDRSQRDRWQEHNQSWWESHPMRYDWRSDVGHDPSSREYYEEIDRRFFEDARASVPWKKVPFDRFIDFDSLADQDVLEIGVGNGSHAQLLASHARSFTGIDLTRHAVDSTAKRLEVMGLPGRVQQMDAEHMDFPDESFDFVWSWGVIHHSADTPAILRHIDRVLRPGGRVVTMVYQRGYWNYWTTFFGHALLSGDLWRRDRSFHTVVQRHTDGAMARYYTIREWAGLLSQHFEVEDVQIAGSKQGLVPLPAGSARTALANAIPDRAARLLSNRLRMGQFLVATARKPESAASS